jgi:hypothetical protein
MYIKHTQIETMEGRSVKIRGKKKRICLSHGGGRWRVHEGSRCGRGSPVGREGKDGAEAPARALVEVPVQRDKHALVILAGGSLEVEEEEKERKGVRRR